MFDNTADFGDSFDAQEEMAEITKTSNLAMCSMDNFKRIVVVSSTSSLPNYNKLQVIY